MKICLTCNEIFDVSAGELEKHKGHTIEMFHKDTLILLGWGHLEAKLHSCLIRVFIHYLFLTRVQVSHSV